MYNIINNIFKWEDCQHCGNEWEYQCLECERAEEDYESDYGLQSLTYEEKQLQRLNLKGVHPLKIVVHDDQGNKTNFMNLNEDLLNALRVIEFYQRKMTEKEAQQ